MIVELIRRGRRLPDPLVVMLAEGWVTPPLWAKRIGPLMQIRPAETWRMSLRTVSWSISFSRWACRRLSWSRRLSTLASTLEVTSPPKRLLPGSRGESRMIPRSHAWTRTWYSTCTLTVSTAAWAKVTPDSISWTSQRSSNSQDTLFLWATALSIRLTSQPTSSYPGCTRQETRKCTCSILYSMRAWTRHTPQHISSTRKSRMKLTKLIMRDLQMINRLQSNPT